MVRLRGRARARGNRRGGPVRAAVGGRGAGRGGGGARGGSNRNMRGGPFTAPLMGRPRPPIMPSLRYGEPDYGYGPRIPPMMPPPMPGPRGLMGRPYAPPVPIPPVPYPRGRPFPGDYPVRHSMGLPPVPPRPMLPPVPPVPPFIRGRGGFRGGMTKSGKVYNNGLMTKGKTNKKKNAKAKRNEINDEFYCEACNRSWSSAEALQEHIAEHEVCGREGCNFSAHPKIVALHVSFHHSTGLYKKIANVQSPEDIAKWIAERKSRYPTEANVAKRVAKEKEMIERGERVEENKTEKNNRPKRGEAKPNNRTNWKERFRKNRENSEKKEAPKQNLALSDEENDDPKKNWNANLPPFQGLISLPTVCDEINPNFDAEGNTVLCCDGFENDNSSELLPPKELCSTTEVKNCLEVPVADVKKEDILSSDCALGTAPANQQESTNISCPNETANTGAISDNMISNHVDTFKLDVDEIADCSTSNQTDESKVPLVPYDEDMDDENGGSEPEECPIMKSTDPSVQTPLESETVTDNVNDSNETTNQKRSRKRQRHHGNSDKKQDPVKKENVVRNRKLTLLEKLLSKEIRHERNVILQCVHYVVSNQFFDNDKGIKSWMDDSDSDSCSD